MRRIAKSSLMIVVAILVVATPLPTRAGESTIDWLALEQAQPIDCPAQVAGVATTELSRCIATGMTDKELRKHLKQRLRAAARDGNVSDDGWRYLDDGISRRLLVHDAYFDLVYAAGGTLAIIPQSCLKAGSNLRSAVNLKAPPRAIEPVHPEYPKGARVERAEGFAVVEGVIGTDGRVTEACVVAERPEGVGFGNASVEALQRTRYEPAREDGTPVPARVTLSHKYSFGTR